MNYQECLDYLSQASIFGIKLGLNNIKTLLESLGSPQHSFPSVLVAGTNGKGSVCAMIQSSLWHHGFRVGLYTSPHLVQIEERIRIGQELIPVEAFCELLTLLRQQVEELLACEELAFPPTYFELVTALAFLYFARQKVDLAVLEVGMGGRLDATNVVDPLVSVITSVSLDHQEHLGQTLRQIAAEKAGIIKPGKPIICGKVPSPARKIIETRAREAGARLINVFGRGKWKRKKGEDFTFIFKHNSEPYVFRPGLLGEHQGRNAAVAIATLAEISQLWKPLQKNKIIEGVEKVKWEGRLEKLSTQPLIFLDGAHNAEGARALRDFWKNSGHPAPILIFAILKDKDIRQVARQLFPLARKVILTSLPFSRAATAEEVKLITHGLNENVVVEPDPWKAWHLAKTGAGKEGAILVTGSLYLVGEIKKRLREESQIASG